MLIGLEDIPELLVFENQGGDCAGSTVARIMTAARLLFATAVQTMAEISFWPIN